MSEKISPELFKHLVELAALELEDDEAEYLRGELNKQLKAIEELAAIPLDEKTAVASHGVPYAEAIRPELRLDIWDAGDAQAEILAQAPDIDNNYIVVPDIPKEELE
jgi:aspartyl/glutamyl-tRNA(Asn/Gln) amidotransferase C subunit